MAPDKEMGLLPKGLDRLLQKVLVSFLFSTTLMGYLSYGDEGVMQSLGKIRSSAELAFSKGEVENALKLWGQVIAMEPSNDGNFFKRFRVYLRQSKLKEALADLNSALQLKPDNEAALVQKGKLEMRLGRCSDALANMQRLQRLAF